MPIYEFYCSDCHTIYNFRSQKINTKKSPNCPQCGRPKIKRQISLFSISKGPKEDDEESMPDIDESRLEKALESMAGEMENVNEEDPKQVAHLMRKLYDATGMNVGPGMEEAISRMEAGEDPDKVGEEMGDLLDGEDPFTKKDMKGNLLSGLRKKLLPPTIDETLYEL